MPSNAVDIVAAAVSPSSTVSKYLYTLCWSSHPNVSPRATRGGLWNHELHKTIKYSRLISNYMKQRDHKMCFSNQQLQLYKSGISAHRKVQNVHAIFWFLNEKENIKGVMSSEFQCTTACIGFLLPIAVPKYCRHCNFPFYRCESILFHKANLVGIAVFF